MSVDGFVIKVTGYRLDEKGSIPESANDSSPLSQTVCGSRSVGAGGSFCEGKRSGVNLSTHLYPLPWLRVCGAVPPLQHVFMAWCIRVGTTDTLILHNHISPVLLTYILVPFLQIFLQINIIQGLTYQ
jgi:hypothetical protein